MKKRNFSRTAMVTLVGLLLMGFWDVPLFGKEGNKEKPIKVKGVIVERLSDSFTMRNYLGSEFLVNVTGETEIEEQKKNIFRDPRLYSSEHLIPGLELTVKGILNSGGMVAEEIKFTQDALKVARVLYSRLHPIEAKLTQAHSRLDSVKTQAGKNEMKGDWLSGQVEEVKAGLMMTRNDARKADRATQRALVGVDAANKRISRLDDYETIRLVTVHFGFDSVGVSTQEKSKLDQLFAVISKETGYLVEIRGFASGDGDESHNRRLSQRRAQTVRQYVLENHDVPLRRFIMPVGYGTKHPVADNSTVEGRKQNRRVEVRILMNRGLKERAGTPGFAARLNPFR